MQIKHLFEKLEVASENSNEIFAKSGMINKFNVLEFGFFPLGSGILTEKCETNSANIAEGGVMILGNDFGTKSYLENGCENKRESSNNPTIRNLAKLGLDKENTFFTNFYLGIRDDVTYPKTTNTKRIKPIEKEYASFCFDFFLTQLRLVNPKIIICLGHAVRIAISENFEKEHHWKPKTVSLKKIYADGSYYFNMNIDGSGERKFIVIPHPCDTRNFSKKFIDKILDVI